MFYGWIGVYKYYTAAKAVDGKPQTRWAVQGRDDQWIRFRLNPDVLFDHLVINWFDYDVRTYDFDLQVSDDGIKWRNLDCSEDIAAGSGLHANYRRSGDKRCRGRNRGSEAPHLGGSVI